MSKWMRDIRHGGNHNAPKLDEVKVDEVVDVVDDVVLDDDLDLEDGE